VDSSAISGRPSLRICVPTSCAHAGSQDGRALSASNESSTEASDGKSAPDSQAVGLPQKELLIIDDHPLMLAILAAVAEKALGDVRVWIATGIEDGITAADDRKPELVLLDLGLPGCSGIEALTRLRERCPEVKIAIVSVSDDRETIQAAFDAGAAGYIPKSLSCDVVVSALRIIAAGSKYVPDQLLSEGPRRHGELSDRQREVLSLMLKGLSNQEIAGRLKIAESTVKQHASVIYEVLNAKTRAEAIVAAARRGYRSIP
jgi:DNA-binding NarL/FixJ family response regulator